MITEEEYDLNYTFYIANRDFELQNYNNQLKSLSESGINILDEAAIGDTISKYLGKIVEGIQKAWDKYKENIINTRIKYRSDEIDKMIKDNPPNIKIENYVTYNTDLLNGIEIKDFYMVSGDQLKDKDTFMRNNYSNVYSTATEGKPNDTDIYKTIKDHVASKPQDTYNITTEDLQNMFKFMQNHKENFGNIEKDLERVNKSVKEANDEVKKMEEDENNASNATNNNVTPPNNNTTNNGNGGETNNGQTNESYIKEADEEPTNKIVTDKSDETDKEGKTIYKEMKDEIEVYFKCSSDIISAKMKLNREIFFFYNSVIEKHMYNCLKGKKSNEAPQVNTEEENNEENGNGGTPQVTP